MTAETSAPAAAPAAAPASRPLALYFGAALSAAEGAALAAWGIYMSVAGLVEDTRNQGLNEFGGFVILLLGLLPLFAAWGLLRLRRWGRSPSVLVHTLCLPVGYFMLQTGGAMAALGVLVALAGVVGVVALLTPKVTEALYR